MLTNLTWTTCNLLLIKFKSSVTVAFSSILIIAATSALIEARRSVLRDNSRYPPEPSGGGAKAAASSAFPSWRSEALALALAIGRGEDEDETFDFFFCFEALLPACWSSFASTPDLENKIQLWGSESAGVKNSFSSGPTGAPPKHSLHGGHHFVLCFHHFLFIVETLCGWEVVQWHVWRLIQIPNLLRSRLGFQHQLPW